MNFAIRRDVLKRSKSAARYCIGGYQPVRIEDLFHQGRYEIVSKLGHGGYSTVWLAFDLQVKQHVALKILTAQISGHGKETFEIDIPRHLKKAAVSGPGSLHILQLLDSFQHLAPNGAHACLVFPAMGPDMSEYRRILPKVRIPSATVKNISRQLLLALSYLHDTCGVIHTGQ